VAKLHVSSPNYRRTRWEFFWDTSFAEFAGWIPLKWNNKFRHSQEWLKERFGGKEAANYAPVDVKLEFAEY